MDQHEGDEQEQIGKQDRPALGGSGLRRRLFAAAAGVALLVLGAVGGVVWSERRGVTTATRADGPAGARAEPAASGSASGAAMPGMAGMPAARAAGASADAAKAEEPVEVSLTPEAVERAGIKTAVVRSEAMTASITVPATVMSNAYRETKVSALVGGVVRQVHAELGSGVKRGELLAVVFSADLADAQMKYLSMRAMLEADHRKRVRTEKLVAVGAASRQELEEVTAVHDARATEVAAARQRLLLLGLGEAQVARLQDASHVVSEVTVAAPADGAVIARSVNPGQVVMAGQDLFVVADLGTVWVIGDVYEKDFAQMRVGMNATVTVPAGSATARGRVNYIDPRVDAATRTAKVRVEVPNPSMALRLGMYVTIAFETGSGERLTLVPRSAVQAVGDRTVVYVDEGDGRFVERPVKVGAATREDLQVTHGLRPGEKVVTEGSFFLRAEAARTRSGG